MFCFCICCFLWIPSLANRVILKFPKGEGPEGLLLPIRGDFPFVIDWRYHMWVCCHFNSSSVPRALWSLCSQCLMQSRPLVRVCEHNVKWVTYIPSCLPWPAVSCSKKTSPCCFFLFSIVLSVWIHINGPKQAFHNYYGISGKREGERERRDGVRRAKEGT